MIVFLSCKFLNIFISDMIPSWSFSCHRFCLGSKHWYNEDAVVYDKSHTHFFLSSNTDFAACGEVDQQIRRSDYDALGSSESAGNTVQGPCSRLSQGSALTIHIWVRYIQLFEIYNFKMLLKNSSFEDSPI